MEEVGQNQRHCVWDCCPFVQTLWEETWPLVKLLTVRLSDVSKTGCALHLIGTGCAESKFLVAATACAKYLTCRCYLLRRWESKSAANNIACTAIGWNIHTPVRSSSGVPLTRHKMTSHQLILDTDNQSVAEHNRGWLWHTTVWWWRFQPAVGSFRPCRICSWIPRQQQQWDRRRHQSCCSQTEVARSKSATTTTNLTPVASVAPTMVPQSCVETPAVHPTVVLSHSASAFNCSEFGTADPESFL